MTTTVSSRLDAPGARPDLDVVIATDLRLLGGTAASVAEEVAAQHAAGYRTGLIHVDSPLSHGLTGLNPRIGAALATGEAELVAPGDDVATRLLVFRHPKVFSRRPGAWPRVHADASVMVVNQPPRDDSGAGTFYRPPEVRRVIKDLVGVEPDWIPIGPLVREALGRMSPDLDLAGWDWTNVLDPGEWAVEREPLADRRPVIGRHSRPQFQKWPDRVEDLLNAYPDDPSVAVAILGGAQVPRRMLRRRLRRLPSNWQTYEFDALPVKDFLARIDFYVYFHHPGWVESFGRAPLEAMATGAVCILPKHFEPLFGRAAVYAEPKEVLGIVTRLQADPDAYQEQAELARQVVADRFSWRTHIERLGRWFDEPPESRVPRVVTSGTIPPASDRRRVLFVSSNGTGMGHLTRLLAMARSSDVVEGVFFTLSQALRSVRALDFPCEYFPSWRTWGIEPVEWNPWFERRLDRVLDLYRPSVVVFDGTVPYPGIVRAIEQRTEVRFVWSRRAMWRPGRAGADRLRIGDEFDAVVEPGELATAFDQGATTAWRADAMVVDPIVLFERDELLSRDAARAELGLDRERPAALLSLGAGTVNRLEPLVEAAIEGMAGTPNVQICLTNPAISEVRSRAGDGVKVVTLHPLARHLRAFDAAVTAAGYNTFHEMIWAGVPTVFVPNEQTSLDNQLARATWAGENGVGMMVREAAAGEHLPTVLRGLLSDAGQRAAMERQCTAIFPRNGARAALDAALGAGSR